MQISRERTQADAAGLYDREVPGPILSFHYAGRKVSAGIGRARHRQAEQDDSTGSRQPSFPAKLAEILVKSENDPRVARG